MQYTCCFFSFEAHTVAPLCIKKGCNGEEEDDAAAAEGPAPTDPPAAQPDFAVAYAASSDAEAWSMVGNF